LLQGGDDKPVEPACTTATAAAKGVEDLSILVRALEVRHA
jgi:hypothetical protein